MIKKTILKYAVAAALTGALALTAVTPSQAGGGRNALGATGFFAADADSADNAYAYDGGYGFNAGYGGYNPGRGYNAFDSVGPGRGYFYGGGNPYRQQGCGASPASFHFDDCS
jgi:hypothetical protein